MSATALVPALMSLLISDSCADVLSRVLLLDAMKFAPGCGG
jgi:hypothetical protein